MGQVLQAGVGQAPARQAALRGGLPAEVPATTINRVCGSGPQGRSCSPRRDDPRRRRRSRRRRRHGEHEPGPYLLPKARFGYRLGNAELIDATVHDGLWCSIEACHMGTHAERVAIKHEVSREDQDQFALREPPAGDRRHRGRPLRRRDRAGARPQGARRRSSTADEGPRRDTSLEALAG
jgi:acetyl-CoA C-acetyltransferase